MRGSNTAKAMATVTAAGVVMGLSMAGAGAAPVQQHPEKPEGPVSVAYVEVNNHDIANVGDYTLEGTNAPVFDIAIIFAANINYDGENAYLHFNERVTETLENVETQVRPLQEQGTQVMLSILGNHQGAGFANFPDQAAAEAFADELADAVHTYGLDGIDFDDEWVNYGANDTGEPNDFSFVYLVSALRERLGPDKLITLYDIGPSAERLEYDGVHLGDVFDYAFQPYYGSYSVPDIPGMSPDQFAPAAIDVQRTDLDLAEQLAQRTVDEGYGAIITYDLPSEDVSDRLSRITEPLYGLPTAYRADPIPDTARPELELSVADGEVHLSATDAGLLDRLAANLYDQHNDRFLQAIGSTPADEPLESAEAEVTWQVPDLDPGHYTVRASATDLAGNVAVRTTGLTVADPIEVWASAAAVCLGDAAHLAVNAANFTPHALDIRLITELGEHKAEGVATTDAVYRAFEAGDSELAGGAVTVAAYYWLDGQGHYERFTVDYEGIDCG